MIENMEEPIHHDCCWFARKDKIDICQKHNKKFVTDGHGIYKEMCRDCPDYAFVKLENLL
jgi:hypothetical protein